MPNPRSVPGSFEARGYPPRNCRICKLPIVNPARLQKVHAGDKCQRQWKIQQHRKLRKKAAAKVAKAERRRWSAIKGTRPLRDKEYLVWIRTLPCCVPECVSRILPPGKDAWSVIEAAHVGDRGLRQKKCSDRETLPFCKFHHTISPVSHHQAGKRFWKYHQMDREALIAAFNLSYEESRAA